MAISLQTQLGVRITLVALFSLGIMVVLLSFIMHQNMHRQTDALLLHLAHAEANNIVEEATDFHVHNMSVHLPSLGGGLNERYALVFDAQGNILDHTANLNVGVKVTLDWIPTEGKHSLFFNSGAVSPKLLRLVVLPMELKGQKAFISVGVAHEDLVASLWSFVAMAIPVALLVALMITGAGVWLIRRRLSDLSRLSEACAQLELFSGKISGDAHRDALTVPQIAAKEFHLLANTLRELVDRVQGLLETQNRFVAEAAHELRTPLTSLRGDLELALRRDRSPGQYREFIQEALEDVDRLQNLAVNLLEGARGRDGNLALQSEPLADLIVCAINQHRKALDGNGFKLSMDVPGELHVLANRSGTCRVLANLVDNAVRHSGGTQLRIWVVPKGDGLELQLADDGKGIPPSLLDGLFHPFQRGSQNGFGLGLYIAHQLMRAQNGDLCLDSQNKELKGACWKLTFVSGDHQVA